MTHNAPDQRRMMRRLITAWVIAALAGTLPTPLDWIQFGAAMVMLWLAYQDLKKLGMPNGPDKQPRT